VCLKCMPAQHYPQVALHQVGNLVQPRAHSGTLNNFWYFATSMVVTDSPHLHCFLALTVALAVETQNIWGNICCM
jgi:hypothetical protein